MSDNRVTRREVLKHVGAVVAATALPSSAAAESQQAPGPSPVLKFFPGFKPLTLHVNGVTINGAMAGQGPPILLLHGAPQSMLSWRLVAPDLAKDHTVVVTDLRGYGDSAPPRDGGSAPNHGRRPRQRSRADGR